MGDIKVGDYIYKVERMNSLPTPAELRELIDWLHDSDWSSNSNPGRTLAALRQFASLLESLQHFLGSDDLLPSILAHAAELTSQDVAGQVPVGELTLEPIIPDTVETQFWREAFREWYLRYAVCDHIESEASSLIYFREICENAHMLAAAPKPEQTK